MIVPYHCRLSKKYPKVVADVIEEKSPLLDGIDVLPDASQPNPNGREFDNLYLDMNGIIHPVRNTCTSIICTITCIQSSFTH